MPAGIRRVLRDPLRVITVLLWIVIVSTVMVAVLVLIQLMNTPPSAQALQNAPPWVTQWLVPFAQGQVRLLMPIVILFGVIVILLLSALTLKFHKADKFSVVGLSFEVPDQLREAERRLEEQIHLVTGLQENTRELADLVQSQCSLIIAPSRERFFEVLDLIVATAAFSIRPEERSLRASIWLCSKASNEIRIVASHRIGARSRRHLVMTVDGPGFAAHVLRSNAPQAKDGPTAGGLDWIADTHSNSSTTAILGQPIQIGSTDDWRAVLCFSTDRQLARPFSPREDAAALNLFSALISATLTSALTWSHSGTPLIEVALKRYI